MESLIRDVIRDQGGYSADHPDAEVILDANESPYDLPASVKEASYDRLRKTDYNRYPDPRSTDLRGLLSEYLNVPVESLVVGNGSDELITYLLTAFVDPGDTVLVPSPTFSMYGILTRQLHGSLREVPLGEDWELTEDFLEAVPGAKLTFLGYPNNPTGTCFDRSVIRRVREASEGLVVVDEAYAEFSGESVLDGMGDREGLVVLRTLSKAFGLAAIRTGALVGSQPVVDAVRTVKLPYNLNRLSQVTAEEALRNREEILEKIDIIRDERDRLEAELSSRGLRPFPSDANFVLFEPPDPGELYRRLLEKGLRVRSFSGPRLSDYLRVTVGTPEQNDRFVECLKET